MFFLFSGEGPTDCGQCQLGADQCDGAEYEHGPMTLLADRIIESRLGYSPLNIGMCGYVSERGLSTAAESLKGNRKSLRLRGKKRAVETVYFYRNAQALASCAAHTAVDRDDEDVVAILFRDSDGTASAGRGLWRQKVQSMLDGFAADGFDRGVPMVPKPKSEAWLLCGLRQSTAAEAVKLESRSGNDRSPKALKKELSKLLDGATSRTEIIQLVEDGKITPDLIDNMPSFHAFRKYLESALNLNLPSERSTHD